MPAIAPRPVSAIRPRSAVLARSVLAARCSAARLACSAFVLLRCSPARWCLVLRDSARCCGRVAFRRARRPIVAPARSGRRIGRSPAVPGTGHVDPSWGPGTRGFPWRGGAVWSWPAPRPGRVRPWLGHLVLPPRRCRADDGVAGHGTPARRPIRAIDTPGRRVGPQVRERRVTLGHACPPVTVRLPARSCSTPGPPETVRQRSERGDRGSAEGGQDHGSGQQAQRRAPGLAGCAISPRYRHRGPW